MTLDELAEKINANHLQVSQRLTAIETTMKNNHDAYGDIPSRVQKLEKFDAKVKTVGSICGAVLAAAWGGLLTLVEHKRW